MKYRRKGYKNGGWDQGTRKEKEKPRKSVLDAVKEEMGALS